MSRELFVCPDVVRRATGALRTSSAGVGGLGAAHGGSIDGGSADAAISRLVAAASGASIALATNIGAVLVAIDDAVGETVDADRLVGGPS